MQAQITRCWFIKQLQGVLFGGAAAPAAPRLPCDLFRVSFGIPSNLRLGCFFEAILAHLVQP